MKRRVQIREVHISTVEVDLPEDATREEIKQEAARVHENLVALSVEYSHTMAREYWEVEEVEG